MRGLFFNSIGTVLLFSLLTACGSGGDTANDQGGIVTPPPVVISPPPVDEMLPIPDNRYVDQYQILLVGTQQDATGFFQKNPELLEIQITCRHSRGLDDHVVH